MYTCTLTKPKLYGGYNVKQNKKLDKYLLFLKLNSYDRRKQNVY